MLGFGSLRPDSRNTSRQSRSASLPFAIASAIVSPSDMHPGMSGYSTRYPPPSSADSGRTVNRYSSNSRFERALMIPNLSSGVDKRRKLFDVDRLYGTSRRRRDDLAYTGRAEDHVTAATPGSAPLNEISFRCHLQLFDAPARLALEH